MQQAAAIDELAVSTGRDRFAAMIWPEIVHTSTRLFIGMLAKAIAMTGTGQVGGP